MTIGYSVGTPLVVAAVTSALRRTFSKSVVVNSTAVLRILRRVCSMIRVVEGMMGRLNIKW